jgi:hypothetical protein
VVPGERAIRLEMNAVFQTPGNVCISESSSTGAGRSPDKNGLICHYLVSRKGDPTAERSPGCPSTRYILIAKGKLVKRKSQRKYSFRYEMSEHAICNIGPLL